MMPFFQGYDSDGLKAEYTNTDYEIHQCETYNDTKVGANNRTELAAPRDLADKQFVLISYAYIGKLKVANLRTELKMGD